MTDELLLLKEMLKKERLKSIRAEENTKSIQEKLDSKEDVVLSLRSEIRSLSEQTLRQQSKNMESTLQLKDQYTEKLEVELKQCKDEIARLSGRYDRKLRKVRELLSRSRQDSALKLFEMKDENAKLAEDNVKLQERLDRMSLNSYDGRFGSAGSRRSCQSAGTTESEPESADNRTKLILELSEQVAQMDAENLKLKQELKHAKKIVEKVERAKLRALKRAQTQPEQDALCVSSGSGITERLNNSTASRIEVAR